MTAANLADCDIHLSMSAKALSKFLTYSVYSKRKGANFAMMSPTRGSWDLETEQAMSKLPVLSESILK